MSETSGPYFANVVLLSGFEGGNADLVNGYYIPSSARLFSFPIYTKFCQRTNSLTDTKLSLMYSKRRYSWIVRDSEERILGRVKYPPNSQASLSLPEHVPSTQCWELLSTGFFTKYKKKPNAIVRPCDDNILLQQMSCFIGSNGYMDSVSESIRFIDSTVQDMEHMLTLPPPESDDDNRTPTDDGSALGNINIDIEDLSLDQIIELYSQEIFNGYGALVHRSNDNSTVGIAFSALQEQLEAQVDACLRSSRASEKVILDFILYRLTYLIYDYACCLGFGTSCC